MKEVEDKKKQKEKCRICDGKIVKVDEEFLKKGRRIVTCENGHCIEPNFDMEAFKSFV